MKSNIQQLKKTDEIQHTNPQLQENKGTQPKIQQLRVRAGIRSGCEWRKISEGVWQCF